MKKQLTHVKNFHETFRVEQSVDVPILIGDSDSELRFSLMQEENEEYLEACRNNDLTEIADALGDQLYILCGTILKHGLMNKIEDIFDEIQASNMSKLDINNEPIFRADGKILKGENFFKPNIEKILNS